MNYVNLLIFGIFLTFVGCLLLGLSYLFSFRRKDVEKLSAYECGFNAFNDSRSGYYLNFYLIALLYILFDLEIALLFPFALSLYYQTSYSLFIMMVFVGLLILGFVYEWCMGALEWR